MFKNYIITAWRNLVRNKIFSSINIIGLSIGIVSCILIFVYLQDEISYDKHWKNAERILRINWEETTDGITDPYSVTSFETGPSLKENFPEVESVVRILPDHGATVSRDGKYFNEEKQFSVDSNFLSVFNFELLDGDSKTCLTEPNSVVISEEMSSRYFGKTNPIGKMLHYPKGLYKVTGILKNTTRQSHLKPNALLSINYKSEQIKELSSNWLWLNAYTYIKLKNKTSVIDFDKKLKKWAGKILVPALKAGNVGYKIELKSEPVSEVHFDNYHKDDFEKSDKNYIFIFSWIAVFILLIGCFNYMNLSTARAAKRSKEIGVRQVSGASRKQLITQFLCEALILSGISLIIGLVLLFFLVPFFNSLTGKNIHPFLLLTHLNFWLIVITLILFISFIGGSYPALYLSGLKPVNILKGKFLAAAKKSGWDKISLRRMLVVSQFAISGSVIICTIIVYSQLNMMKNKNLGFNKDQVLVLKFPDLDSLNIARAGELKNRIAGNPLVKKVAMAKQVLNVGGNLLFRVKNEGKIGQASINIGGIDENYLDLLDIKITRGRNFSKDYGQDKESFILNETAVKFLKLKDPLSADLSLDGENYGKIIGVVKDFNYRSPHSKIDPLVFVCRNVGYFAFVKLSPHNIPGSIDAISKEWKEIFSQDPISYFFLDERFNRQYKSENTMLVLFICFSILTIFISCLGLFGLAAFITEQRTKEIGIRKVVGATVSNIVYHISKDFLFLVLAASIIASPVAFYFINKWLQQFAYRIEIELWIFIATGLLSIAIAFLTMSLQTIKAAYANPIKSLRTE